MIKKLINAIKRKFNKNTDTFKITYVVPKYIGNIEADDRVEFMDYCISKSKWITISRDKHYNYVKKSNAQKILEQNTYIDHKYFIEYELNGDYSNTRAELIRVFTEYLDTVKVSSIDNNSIFEIMLTIETRKGNNWITIQFIKENEKWYLNGVNTRGC